MLETSEIPRAMSDSENSDSDTAKEQYSDDEEVEEVKELYIDEDEFWDASETDDELDEPSSDSKNEGKNIQNSRHIGQEPLMEKWV